MLFVSKGIPEKEGISVHLRIMSSGMIYTLCDMHEAVWLRGRLNISETVSEAEKSAVCDLLRMVLVEYAPKIDPAARYSVLSRCIIVPTQKRKRVSLRPTERFAMVWLREAGLRLSLAELVFLYENGVRPGKNLLGQENRQALVERICTTDTIDYHILEVRMSQAAKRGDVVDAVLGLLKKKRVVLL